MGFKSRLVAAGIHLLVTAVVALCAAGVVFGVWFPGDFASIVGGVKLFLILLCCDLVLGPLISLVIYDRKKPRAELVRDYVIVGVLQVSALVYGMFVIAESRPVYVVFVVDRLEVVAAAELDAADLKLAKEVRYQTRGWLGPQLVSAERPKTPEERSQLLFSALDGKDIQVMPKYYREYSQGKEQILKRSFSVSALLQRRPDSTDMVRAAIKKASRTEKELRWIPVSSRFGFGIALISAKSGLPVRYLPIDPY